MRIELGIEDDGAATGFDPDSNTPPTCQAMPVRIYRPSSETYLKPTRIYVQGEGKDAAIIIEVEP